MLIDQLLKKQNLLSSLHGVATNLRDCNIVGSMITSLLYYYAHLQINSFGEDMTPITIALLFNPLVRK